MKPDIQNRTDIKRIVQLFYERLMLDARMADFFGEQFSSRLAEHLPRMYDYWDNALFHTGTYRGNPMKSHEQMHQLKPMQPEHFRIWLRLLHECIDSLYEGYMADQLKLRSRNIGYLMQARVLNQPPDEAAYEAMLPSISPPPTMGTKL